MFYIYTLTVPVTALTNSAGFIINISVGGLAHADITLLARFSYAFSLGYS